MLPGLPPPKWILRGRQRLQVMERPPGGSVLEGQGRILGSHGVRQEKWGGLGPWTAANSFLAPAGNQ